VLPGKKSLSPPSIYGISPTGAEFSSHLVSIDPFRAELKQFPVLFGPSFSFKEVE